MDGVLGHLFSAAGMHHEHALLIWIFWEHCYFTRLSFLAAFSLVDAFVCLTRLPVFDTPSYQPLSTLALHLTTQHFPKHPQFLPRDREHLNWLHHYLSERCTSTSYNLSGMALASSSLCWDSWETGATGSWLINQLNGQTAPRWCRRRFTQQVPVPCLQAF